MALQSRPFSGIANIEAPGSLRESVRARVAVIERRAWIFRFSGLAGLALVSVSGFVASCAYVYQAVAASGFIQYVSLIFSDGTDVLAFSKELSLSMLESLPAFGIALVLAAGLVAVGSVMTSVRFARHFNSVA
ncbi:MAG TPA: hypothetical protein VHE10_02835 [Candidatus Paceibacterota bacterium]|nr:hypothetical protein [Candidatus Paceibacterota bacterium]